MANTQTKGNTTPVEYGGSAGAPGQAKAAANGQENLPMDETSRGAGPMNAHPRPPSGRHMGGDGQVVSLT